MKSRVNRLDKAFWKAMHRFSESAGPDVALQKQIEMIIEQLTRQGATPPQKVLDAGCEDGFCTLALAQAGFEATGIGPTSMTLTQADRRATHLNLAVTFERMNLDGPLWYTDSEFDHALCLSLLPVVRRAEQLLTELYRVLKPGGLLVVGLPLEHHRIETASVGSNSGLGKAAVWLQQARKTAAILTERPSRAKQWTKEQFQIILEKHDFEVLSLGPSTANSSENSSESTSGLIAVARRA